MSREQRILELLQKMNPSLIELKNESQKHAGHVAHLGPSGFTGETHYKLLIVADVFNTMSRIDRQRMVNDVLKDEFQTGLHAFEMKIYTTEEYSKLG
jgi:stress-induced morphogen